MSRRFQTTSLNPVYQAQIAAQLARHPKASPLSQAQKKAASRTEFVIAVEPMGAPRQTRADAWKKRPVVLRYRAYADTIRAACVGMVPDPVYFAVTAYFTMPASWPKKKRQAMAGELHRQRPDADNIFKGASDSLVEADQCIAIGLMCKRWDDGKGARLELTVRGDVEAKP